jgi:2-(1,2-epoxy-1,2-dihydrophenyl)acetyl-CoA isomerase
LDYQNIVFSKEGRVATIRLNRRESLNPLSVKTVSEISDAVNDVARDDKIMAIILTGTGRAFSAGGDLKAMVDFFALNPSQIQEELQTSHLTVLRMRKLEKPIIAAINGLCHGAALDFILACDIRISSAEARFCEAYLRVALTPGNGAMYWLPRYIGFGRALDMILNSKTLDADEALRIGLVDYVVSQDKLEEAAAEQASKLARGPTKQIGLVKRTMLRAAHADFETEQMWTTYEQAVHGFLHPHTQEAIKAFLEKREPEFE